MLYCFLLKSAAYDIAPSAQLLSASKEHTDPHVPFGRLQEEAKISLLCEMFYIL